MLMIDQPFRGGGQKHLLSLAAAISRTDFHISVCSRAGGPLVAEVSKLGLRHFPAGFSKTLRPKILKRIGILLREESVDILHTHGSVAGFYGRWAARRGHIPVVAHTFHGIHYLYSHNIWRKRLYSLLERHLSRFTDAVICVSDHVRDEARRYRLVPENRLIVIKNGIDYSRIQPALRQGDNLRATKNDLAIDPAAPVVGTVARLDPIKGLAVLVRAAELIRQELPEARILIVGTGPQEAELIALIRKLRLQGIIQILGEREDALRLMAAFDVFVLPSFQEALPYAILEAGALELPVAASDVGGIRELVSHEETGLLVPPDDPESLASAVVRFLQNPDFASACGRRLRSAHSSTYTLDQMVARTQDLYLRLLETQRDVHQIGPQ